jgi:peptidoglycan/xylan/chitin deacetylase (PgdA/CDA1 family)
MYHRIAEETFDPWQLAVSPANFADQLRWLSNQRTVLPLWEFAERHASQTLSGDAAAITFDDGYDSVATVAAPLLEEYQLPATVFLPVELIERGRPFWWDELQQLVLDFRGNCLVVGGQAVTLGNRSPSDREWSPSAAPQTARQAAFQRSWAMLRCLTPADLERAMQDLREQMDAPPSDDFDLPMKPAQVRAISSMRIQFGSHALTHPSLPTLQAAEKAAEIRGSFERMKALTGVTPLSFAYPYGDRDEKSEAIVRQAGFLCACTTEGHPLHRRSSLFALPRVGVGNVDARRFAHELAAT